jgi:predicted  nucleic acid-binding Zn-ribbon protein
MTDAELLLTDEFVEFSKAIAEVHEEKKVLEAEFKKHFEEYKAHKKNLEERVSAASAKWEDWKKEQLQPKKEK